MSLHEVSEAAKIVQEAADPDANIIFGTVIDPKFSGSVKVTVIATGFVHGGHRRVPVREPVVESVSLPPQALVESAPEPEPRRPERYFRRGAGEPLEFDANDDGFTPNFSKMKDDLDVPAFLRKQMD
jgi:cell division protein FtsZ